MLQIVVQKGHGYVHPDGFPRGFQVPSIAVLYKELPGILTQLGEEKENVFYTLAHHSGLGQVKPSRSFASFEYQTVLPFDIDVIDTQRVGEYLLPVARVLGLDPANLIANVSGNGLQILVHLKTPVRSAKYLKETKPAYNEICYLIAKEIRKAGLPLDKVDPVVWDAARIFRLPGTINQKKDRPRKEATHVQYTDAQFELDLWQISGLDQVRAQNISPEEISRQYPKPDFVEIVKECRFIQWAITKPEEVHEPDFFKLASLMVVQEPKAQVLVAGTEKTAMALTEHVFTHATASPSLGKSSFEEKWEGASRYGAPKCGTIAADWDDGCKSCPHRGKIPTPLALRSKMHIGSEELGFWVLGQKGQHLHPHYGDLARVYKQEHPYVVTGDQSPRLFLFDHTHYTESNWPTVRGWVERKVAPSDPIRDVHCREFAKKVEREGILSAIETERLFNDSTYGRLNCQNGVLNILTGDLEASSPGVGFKYVLPYTYQDEELSDLFLGWLELVTKSDPDLMESLLDAMAYCLWPNYDDHVFLFLVGKGANGKGTFMRLLQAIVGHDNFSAVSIQQLGGNRFAPSLLEGKLINLSSESSGYKMTLEEMNVIKALSGGDEITVERKGSQGFKLKNKAKLFFSANEPPQFQESGHALTRRLLAIPFDHTIDSPDPRIEEKLIKEVPKIVPLLVRRMQENVQKNGGFFRVHRGGQAANSLQERMLTKGNSVVEWANERVESHQNVSPDEYITASEAYSDYVRWCGLNNYKIFNKGLFGHTMYQFVISRIVNKDKNKVRINGKETRVFRRARWKDEE